MGILAFFVAILGFWLMACILLAAGSFWRPGFEERIWAQTSDGWKLPLYRVHTQTPQGDKPSLLLIHGIFMSRHCWLPQESVPSLARSLAALGYPVWVAELRGSGASEFPSKESPWSYSFLDYADNDLPALCAALAQQDPHRPVTVLGHSMGGMISYAHLGRHKEPPFQSLVTLGSPVLLGQPHIPLWGLSHLLQWLKKKDRPVPLVWLPRLFAPFLLLPRAPWVQQFMNIRGIPRAFALGVKVWGIQTTSSRMLAEMGEWQVESGPWLPRVTSGNFQMPNKGILALHGSDDRMGSPRNIAHLADSFPHATIEAAESGGASRPFGHLDLLSGTPHVVDLAKKIDRFLTS